MKYLWYRIVVLCEPPRFSPFDSSSNWCLIEHYKPIVVLILYTIANWDLFLTQNCLSPIHSSYSFSIIKTCFYFGGVIRGHITQSSSSSIVCLGVCFEKGNACSGGHSVFQNGPLPYPALSTFFFFPLVLGIMRENKKKKELALFNPFFLFFLNYKLSLFNVVPSNPINICDFFGQISNDAKEFQGEMAEFCKISRNWKKWSSNSNDKSST